MNYEFYAMRYALCTMLFLGVKDANAENWALSD
jgi:hypothetical protein